MNENNEISDQAAKEEKLLTGKHTTHDLGFCARLYSSILREII